MIRSLPSALLRLEAAALVALSVGIYVQLAAPWLLFAALFLVPDFALLGYRFGARAGATAYNLFHTSIGPVVLLATGFLSDQPMVMAVAAIWLTHIGLDRLLGYGLKYPTFSKDTHLARV